MAKGKGTVFYCQNCGYESSKVPVQLGVIDYKNKDIIICEEYFPTGDVEKDMSYIRSFYSRYSDVARYPEKFKA